MARSNKTSQPSENTGDHEEIEQIKLDIAKANDLIVECFNINRVRPSAGMSALANVLSAMLEKYGTKAAWNKVIEFLIQRRDIS